MKRQSILALDGGTQTGFAIWTPGSKMMSGVIKLPKVCAQKGKYFAQEMGDFDIAAYKMLQEFDDIHKPKHIIFEAPFIGFPNAVWKCFGFAHMTMFFCRNKHIPFEMVLPKEWRKVVFNTAHGKRKVVKNKAFEAVRQMGLEAATDDEADAICIMDYYATRECLKKDWKDPGQMKFIY